MAACLIVEHEGSGRMVVVLDAEVTSLGRGENNDVATEDQFASRRHAQIRRIGAMFVLEDLESKNGVFVNGRRVSGSHVLSAGDSISLPGLTAVFSLGDQTFTQQRAAGEPIEGLRVDEQTAEVWVDGREVAVTAKEFLALRALARHQGGLVTKEQIARDVWPEYDGAVGDYNIEQLISRLRRKVELNPGKPVRLLTVRGLGYRLLTG